jgi:hypothetical protein
VDRVKVEARLKRGAFGPYAALYVDGRRVPGIVKSVLEASADQPTLLTVTIVVPAEDDDHEEAQTR